MDVVSISLRFIIFSGRKQRYEKDIENTMLQSFNLSAQAPPVRKDRGR